MIDKNREIGVIVTYPEKNKKQYPICTITSGSPDLIKSMSNFVKIAHYRGKDKAVIYKVLGKKREEKNHICSIVTGGLDTSS